MTRTGNTWWSSRFLRSLDSLGLSSRMQRGREFLRRGNLLSLVVGPNGVEARVQGTTEYLCRIEFEPLSDLEWEESLERLAFQDLSAAALLTTGRLPPHIEDFFLPSGRRLLPQQSGELEFQCSCPDRLPLCEHLAATAYLFAERLDRDPWLLFLVRGRSADQVKAALAERWNRDLPRNTPQEETVEDSAEKAAVADVTDVDVFWEGTRRAESALEARWCGKPGLTAKRLATPEPKVDEKAWLDLLGDLYTSLSKRAEQRLSES